MTVGELIEVIETIGKITNKLPEELLRKKAYTVYGDIYVEELLSILEYTLSQIGE